MKLLSGTLSFCRLDLNKLLNERLVSFSSFFMKKLTYLQNRNVFCQEDILAKCFTNIADHTLLVLNITGFGGIHFNKSNPASFCWSISNSNGISPTPYWKRFSHAYFHLLASPFSIFSLLIPLPHSMCTPVMSPDSASLLSFTSLTQKSLIIVALFGSLPRSSDHGHHLAWRYTCT